MEIAKMSFSMWMDKQTVIHPDNGEASLRRLHTVWFQLYVILKEAKLEKTIKMSVFARRWGADEKAEHRGFSGQWKYSI